MRNLLKEFWSKYQFQYKFVDAAEGQEWSLKALKLAFRDTSDTTMAVYLEQRWFIAMILIPVVYVFAGETANQWFYLICSGIVSSLLVGFFLPLMQVKDV